MMEKVSAEEVAAKRQKWNECSSIPRGHVLCAKCRKLRLLGTSHECKWEPEV